MSVQESMLAKEAGFMGSSKKDFVEGGILAGSSLKALILLLKHRLVRHPMNQLSSGSIWEETVKVKRGQLKPQ